MFRGKFEGLNELNSFIQPRKNGEFALKRIFAKEHIKHGVLIVSACFPVRVRHCNLHLVDVAITDKTQVNILVSCYLVHIRQHRADEIIQRLLAR